MRPAPRLRPAPLRPFAAARAELARLESRLDELRRDPAFLACGSAVATEHNWVSRRLASVRAELAGAALTSPVTKDHRR